jgi:hypothetical protein
MRVAIVERVRLEPIWRMTMLSCRSRCRCFLMRAEAWEKPCVRRNGVTSKGAGGVPFSAAGNGSPTSDGLLAAAAVGRPGER